jgi:hypothetical protein
VSLGDAEPGVMWGDPRPGKWIAAAKPEGLTVGLIQSVAFPSASSWNQIAAFIKARLLVRSIETYRSGVIPTSPGLTLSWRRRASTGSTAR